MICNQCGIDKKTAARGLCSACYTRQIRGSIEKVNQSNKNKICAVGDCREQAVAKGFCLKHYRLKSQHPLNAIWKIIRSRAKGNYPPAWDDFKIFLADVGERPSPHHQLRKLHADQPYSKENLEWLEPLAGKRNSWEATERAAYSKGYQLRKVYKISQAGYDAMLAAQNGVCAICKGPETHVVKKTGKLKALAVDHCHKTGRIRGLGCSRCNTILGYANDDPDLFRAFITYLESHEALATQPPDMT